MRQSFTKGTGALGKELRFEDKGHRWRNDSIAFDPIDNWKYLLLFFFNQRNNSRFFRKVERGLFKIFFIKEWI